MASRLFNRPHPIHVWTVAIHFKIQLIHSNFVVNAIVFGLQVPPGGLFNRFFFWNFFFWKFFENKKWKRPHPIEKVLRATAYLVNQGPCAIFLSLGSPPHLPVPHWSAVEHLNTKEKGRVKLSIKKKRQTLVVFSPQKIRKTRRKFVSISSRWWALRSEWTVGR